MKKLFFLSTAFIVILAACSKDKSEDLIEPMTKSGDVTILIEGKQEVACSYPLPIYDENGTQIGQTNHSGKKCIGGMTTCAYKDICGPVK